MSIAIKIEDDEFSVEELTDETPEPTENRRYTVVEKEVVVNGETVMFPVKVYDYVRGMRDSSHAKVSPITTDVENNVEVQYELANLVGE